MLAQLSRISPRIIDPVLGRTPAYEPRGYVNPVSVLGVIMAVLGLTGLLTRRYIPRYRGWWMFGSLFLLSAGFSFTATAVAREVAAQQMAVRSQQLDRLESGIAPQLDELDPFARVQLLARLAQDEAARYGIGVAA